ncbi:hypothetical protein EYR40_003633 [Pleurotus pulmonarius]|nr:hypothetical protein EYR40_003633 [Pleurotus pulmonarius]KAF4606348.1 hypothetical protein EYR38_000401 [Pleurotus pulmonarius]
MLRILQSWRAALVGCAAALLLRYYQSQSYKPSLTSTSTPHAADVTAILLNWSRFPNVVKIASVLCDPNLDTVIQNVTVWNNNPTPLGIADFADANCPSGKLHIYNSPTNVLFQARYIACEQAATPYCFIQDDDYLVLPEIIRTMRARIPQSAERGIHLLPPHEMLSTTHTGFAWLGYGAMISRTRASEFLQLMHAHATDEERRMADNYYTILANRVPEVWFDQGVPLGGGEAFTVGTEGDERNERHIRNAIEMLGRILQSNESVPYVNRDLDSATLGSVLIAPRRGSDGLFETNIDDATLDHPPSHAVDGRTDTAFCPASGARKGEHLLLDIGILVHPNASLAFLVDPIGCAALRSSAFEGSADGFRWGSLGPSCLVAPMMIAASSSSATTTTTITTTSRRLTKSPPPSPPSPPRTRKLSKKRRILEFTYLSDHDIQSARSSIARSRTLSSISGISDRLSFKRGTKKTNAKLSLDEQRGGDEEYEFVQPERTENWLPPLKLGSPAFDSSLSSQASPNLTKNANDMDWDPDLHLLNFALHAFGHHDAVDADGIANGTSKGIGSYETEGPRISLSMNDIDPMAPGRPSTTSSRAKFIIGDGDGMDNDDDDGEHDAESPASRSDSVPLSLKCVSSPSSPVLPVPPLVHSISQPQSLLPTHSPTQTSRPTLTRRHAFDVNSHWTLRMALIDDRLSDELLVKVLERCVSAGGTKTTGKDEHDYRSRPLPPIPTSETVLPLTKPHQTLYLNPHLPYYLPSHHSHRSHPHIHHIHHPHPHPHPHNNTKAQFNPQNPTFRHILLTVRELIRTEKNYLDSLKMLLIGYSGPQEYQSQPSQYLQVRTHATNGSSAANARHRYSSYTQPNSPTRPTSYARPISTIAANAYRANGDALSASPQSAEWTTEDVEVDDGSSTSHSHTPPPSHAHSYYSHPHYPHPSFPSSHHYPHPHPSGYHPHPHRSSHSPSNLQPNSKHTPPPLMRAYISELVQVSEAFVTRMEKDLCVGGVSRAFVGMCGSGNSVSRGMSANGIPTEASGFEDGDIREEDEEDLDGMEGSLERAYVAWCGVVGTWFVDGDERSESGHGRHSGKRESKRERERKVSHGRGREEPGKDNEAGGMGLGNGEVRKKSSGRRKLSKARHSKAVGGIISLNTSSSSNYASDPSTSTSAYVSPSTSTPISTTPSSNALTATNVNYQPNSSPDEADDGRRITSKSRTTSTTSLKRKMSQWRKSLPSVPGYFGIGAGSSSGGSTPGGGRDLRGMRGGTVSMYGAAGSTVVPPLPLPLPPSVTRNGGATPRARQQTLPPGLTMTMTMPTTAVSTATASATPSSANGMILLDGGERKAFDLGRNGISDDEEEKGATGSSGVQTRDMLLAVGVAGGSQTRKKSTKSIKSIKSTKSTRSPTPPTAFSMRGMQDFGGVGDYGFGGGVQSAATVNGHGNGTVNGYGGSEMAYLLAGQASLNGDGPLSGISGADEGTRGMQTRSKSAVSVGMGSMVGRSLSFVGIGSRKNKNSDGQGSHRRGESIDIATAGGGERRNGIDFGGGSGGWVVDDWRRNGADSGHINTTGAGAHVHAYAPASGSELGGAHAGRGFGEYGGDGDKTPRKLPTVRDLAILPTQRVMRYVLLFRGESLLCSLARFLWVIDHNMLINFLANLSLDLLAHIPATSPSRAIVEKAVDAAVRVAEKCDRAQGNAAFLRTG